jgi:uncharacterized protein
MYLTHLLKRTRPTWALATAALALMSLLGAFTFKQAAKLEKALLWEISGKGLSQPSYLYGTIHAICPQDLVLTEAVKAKLKSSGQLSLEIDMDDPNMMAAMMQEVGMKDGQHLRALVTEAQYSRLQTYFSQQIGMDLNLVETWKPLMLSSLMMLKMVDCQPQSYEATFMKMAQEQGKEVIGIETVAAQLAAFDKIPYKMQAQMLVESLDKMEENKALFQRLIALYKQQDLEGFQQVFKEASAEMENFSEVLLVERNKRWIPVMEQEAREKPTFFAVGAGHLGGDAGLIQLLRKAGYQVKPVL